MTALVDEVVGGLAAGQPSGRVDLWPDWLAGRQAGQCVEMLGCVGGWVMKQVSEETPNADLPARLIMNLTCHGTSPLYSSPFASALLKPCLCMVQLLQLTGLHLSLLPAASASACVTAIYSPAVDAGLFQGRSYSSSSFNIMLHCLCHTSVSHFCPTRLFYASAKPLSHTSVTVSPRFCPKTLLC